MRAMVAAQDSTHRQSMFRTEVFLTLIVFALTSSVCGLSQLQVAEGANATLQWDSPTSLDLASLIIYCFSRSSPWRVVFQMAEGVELTEEGRGTFSGRVHCDREALRLGQVRIHLTRLTPQDSGLYWCYMYGNYDREKRDWTQKSSEYFLLNVMGHGRDPATRTRPENPRVGDTQQNKSDLVLFQKVVLCLIFGSMALMVLSIVVTWIIHLPFTFSRTKENLIPV